MKSPKIFIKCFETDEDIFALKASWEELHKNCGVPSVYNSFMFIYESIQAFKDNEVTRKIFTLADENTNQLMAIFPMQKYKNFWMSIPFNSLETTALNEIMDKPFPLIRAGFHDICWKAMFSHLKNNVPDWDHLSLEEIPSSYPVLELLPEICLEQNLIYQVEFDSISTEVNVDGNWNDFWLKHKKMRRNISKLERFFEERLLFTVHDNRSEERRVGKEC